MKVVFDSNVVVSAALKDRNPEKDAKFLACAIAADADYFITGDQDFSEAQMLLQTKIYSVTQFKARLIDAVL